MGNSQSIDEYSTGNGEHNVESRGSGISWSTVVIRI